MHIFEGAKALLWTGLQVKLDFTRRLPWSLAGIAAHDLAKARAIGKGLMDDFDSQQQEVQLLHHRLAQNVLGRTSELRADLEAFVAGAPWSNLPRLARAILPFKFIPIVERYIEAGHSLVKRSVPYRHSPPLVSLARRLPRLEDTLSKQPEVMRDLLACFDQSRAVGQIPALLGISAHPAIQSLGNHGRRNDGVVKACNCILYRADLHGQFFDVKQAQKHHTREQAREDRHQKKVVPTAQAPLPTYENVLRNAIPMHFQSIANKPSERLKVYSLPHDAVVGTVD